jgi:hypothetical protein
MKTAIRTRLASTALLMIVAAAGGLVSHLAGHGHPAAGHG